MLASGFTLLNDQRARDSELLSPLLFSALQDETVDAVSDKGSEPPPDPESVSGSEPGPRRKTLDFLLDKDGHLDLDFEQQGKSGIDGSGMLGEGMGDITKEGRDAGAGDDDDGSERWIIPGENEFDENTFEVDWMAAAKHRARWQMKELEARSGPRGSPRKRERIAYEEAVRKNVS